jgi:hypothetical protein
MAMSTSFSQHIPQLPMALQKQNIDEEFLWEGPALSGANANSPPAKILIKTTHFKGGKFIEMTIQFGPPHQDIKITSDTVPIVRQLLTYFNQK